MADNKNIQPQEESEAFGQHSGSDDALAPSPTQSPENQPADLAPVEPTIQLDHFLQSCGVPTGGQAKRLIQSGEIRVNEKVETRRKKKLRLGDVVAFDGEEFEVALQPPENESEIDSEDQP